MQLQTYGTFELRQTSADEPWDVRNECERRSEALGKKLMRLRKQLAKVEAEIAENGETYKLALREIERHQGLA